MENIQGNQWGGELALLRNCKSSEFENFSIFHSEISVSAHTDLLVILKKNPDQTIF